LPRNSSGTCSPPGGTTAVPGTVIQSTPYNNAISDLYSILTDSLSRTGQGGMQSDLDMGGNQITALAAPIAGTDAVNKDYADSIAAVGGNFIGGTSTGTVNAQAVAIDRPAGFAQEIGDTVTFPWGFTNTELLTLDVETIGAADVRKIGPAGPVPTTGGEAVAGNQGIVVWDGTYWVLQNPANSFGGVYTNLASAATTDLGTIPSRSVNVTGTTTITAFGSTASTDFPLYFLTFASALTLTHDGTALILPGAANIITAAGDSAIARYLGSGNWRVLSYTVAAQPPNVAAAIGLPPPYRLVVNVTSDTNVDVDASQVVVSNGTQFLALNAVDLTINIATSGANGLDTGSEASSTWYYPYVIYNPATATTAGLLSLSATSPTLPNGYTYFRRVGAVRNNGSSNLYRTRQVGNVATYIYGTNPASATTLSIQSGNGTGTPSISAFAPPTAGAINVVVLAVADTLTASAWVGTNSTYYSAGMSAEDNDGDKTARIPATIWLNGTTIAVSISASSNSNVTAAGWSDFV
jgi:hypothetical protein